MSSCIRWVGIVGLCLLVTVAITGCGQSGPKLGEVGGKVIDKEGKPLAKAIVNFQPTSGEQDTAPSYGKTDDQGVYTLQYTEDKMGAIVGPHLVTVRVPNTDIEGTFQKEVKPGSNTIDLNMKESKKPVAGGDSEGDSGDESN